MKSPLDMDEFHAKLRRLELLVRECEQIAETSARTSARDVVQALLELQTTIGLIQLTGACRRGG